MNFRKPWKQIGYNNAVSSSKIQDLMKIARFKKVIIIQGLILATTFFPDSSSALSPLPGKYVYSIKYANIPAMEVQVNITPLIKGGAVTPYNKGHSVYSIRASTKSNRFFSSVFKVDNTYASTADLESGYSIDFSKEIHQSNITQELKVRYDQENHRAERADGSTYPVLPNTHDLLSFLIYTTAQPLSVGDKLEMSIDVEGTPWHLVAEVISKEKVRSPWGRINAILLKSIFTKVGEGRSDISKTDLLTNNLIRADTDLRVWLSDNKDRIILKIEYGRPPFKVSMELKEMIR